MYCSLTEKGLNMIEYYWLWLELIGCDWKSSFAIRNYWKWLKMIGGGWERLDVIESDWLWLKKIGCNWIKVLLMWNIIFYLITLNLEAKSPSLLLPFSTEMKARNAVISSPLEDESHTLLSSCVFHFYDSLFHLIYQPEMMPMEYDLCWRNRYFLQLW